MIHRKKDSPGWIQSDENSADKSAEEDRSDAKPPQNPVGGIVSGQNSLKLYSKNNYYQFYLSYDSVCSWSFFGRKVCMRANNSQTRLLPEAWLCCIY